MMQDKLDTVIETMDLGEITLRGYFKKLLETMWNEGEGFSGKRPFGNSGWEIDLEHAIAKAGLVEAEFDEEFEEWEYDPKIMNKFVFDAIEAL